MSSVRVVAPWNSLSQHVVEATSVDCFKWWLDRHWFKARSFKVHYQQSTKLLKSLHGLVLASTVTWTTVAAKHHWSVLNSEKKLPGSIEIPRKQTNSVAWLKILQSME